MRFSGQSDRIIEQDLDLQPSVRASKGSTRRREEARPSRIGRPLFLFFALSPPRWSPPITTPLRRAFALSRPNRHPQSPPFEGSRSASYSQRRGRAKANSEERRNPYLISVLARKRARPHRIEDDEARGCFFLSVPYRPIQRRGRRACPRARRPTRGRRPRSRDEARRPRRRARRRARGRRGRKPFFFLGGEEERKRS